MSNTVKAGLSVGALAFVVVVLFGGWSTLLAAIIAGGGAAVLVDSWTAWRGRSEAITGSLVAGVVAGLLAVGALIIHTLMLLPAAGRSAEAETVPWVTLSVVALAAAALLGALVGYINTLPDGTRRVALLGLLGLMVVIYPYFDQMETLGIVGTMEKMNWLGTMIGVLIFIVLALGLNIVVGYAGLLDLGYAAFFAIGAYTTGLILSPHLADPTINAIRTETWAFWLAIWVAAAVAAIFGIILGAPTLPLRGDYLAIVTLGFGEIVPIVFRNLTRVDIREPITGTMLLVGKNLTGGEAGVNPISRPWLPGMGFFQTGQYLPWYFLIIGIIVFSIFMINRLRNSRLGRAWAAMREDELAAASMGIDIVRTKLLAFAMGATFSGFGGAFFASYIGAIFPGVFDFSVSVIILCMVILGGLGNMAGVILGGLIIMMSDRLFLPQMAALMKAIMNTSILPNVTSPALRDFLTTSVDPSQWRLMLFGLTLVIMMIVRPEGLIPNTRRRAELHEGDEPHPKPRTERETAKATQIRSVTPRDVTAE